MLLRFCASNLDFVELLFYTTMSMKNVFGCFYNPSFRPNRLYSNKIIDFHNR
jgi:hypothetical protein